MTEAVLSGWHGVAAWRLPSRWWGIPSSMRSLGGTPALRRYSELGGQWRYTAVWVKLTACAPQAASASCMP